MGSGGDADDPQAAAERRAWEAALDDDANATTPDDASTPAEVIFDSASATAEDATSEDAEASFAALLRSLRTLSDSHSCMPPVGEGAFDILYASAREIVVWYIPAKDGVEQREVAIPARLARAAWEALLRGDPVDEATLCALAGGLAGGRWLLALFAQAPAVEVRHVSPADDNASASVTLQWRGASAG
jgi:hypothetical protein